MATNYVSYIKIHPTLRVSPAMAAGVADLFDVMDLVSLLIESEQEKVTRKA